MTIDTAIARANDAMRNGMETSRAVTWLSDLDARLYAEVISTHEGAGMWEAYGEGTSGDTVLLASGPYESLYEYWLMARMHERNQDDERYNACITQFNALCEAWKIWYNKQHRAIMPKARWW